MDIIKFYSANRDSFSFSEFVSSHRIDVARHSATMDLNDDEDWETLKKNWYQLAKDFKARNEEVQITLDLFKVDWNELLMLRNSIINSNKNKRSIAESLVEFSQEVSFSMTSGSSSGENPFLSDDNPSIANIVYENKIKEIKSKMKYVKELGKQNMLYFGIIDFAVKTQKNQLYDVFGKPNYKFFKSKFTNVCKGNTEAGNICKLVLNSVHFATNRKKAIKKEKKKKQLVSGGKDEHIKMWVLKVIKLHCCNLQEDDYANEDTFLYFVLSPILKNLLQINSRTALLFGETNLKSKAAEINRHLFDDERRYAGPKIDVIVKDKKYNLEMMIIEISGPFEKVNNTHYLEDRNKICKNLKAMFKNIVSHMEVPSKTLIRKLKLYGLQFYNGQVFVYSICKPCDHSYVFVNDYSFSSLGPSSSINPQVMPSFVKNMYGISYLVEDTQHILDKFLDNIDLTQDVLEEVVDEPSPHVSPHKKQKKKNDTTS